jgi:hypothetical protein
MVVAVFNASHMIMMTSDVDPRSAWSSAVSAVRMLCHGAGVTGLNDGWYQTRNRVGYAMGQYRATELIAEVP